ncbi:MAG: SDR family oxidoreductase [Acidimicrobiia bacterium]|nr:SDR family oxidoreductase [Acidimicrobiia bacterium]
MTTCRRYTDRVVVVTGGTTGIGLATVRRLHDEGAAVVFCGRRPDVGDEVAGAFGSARAVFVAADVTVRSDLEALYATTIDRFGRLDAVVNNAGNVVVGPTMGLRPDDWRRTMALNLDAVFDSCQLAIGHLRRTIASGSASGAAIVNVASLDSVGADRGFAAYNAAKAGVVNFTRALALEFGPEGIRANAVSPGAIETPLTTLTTRDPRARAAFEAAIPLRRYGQPDEIAAAIAFLAADEAGFVNGANLLVDGGVTAGTGHPDVMDLFGMG